jgi:hypothetical protein
VPRRGLRERPLGKLLLLVLVLVAAFAVARTCGSANQNVSKEEAIEIATRNVGFEPCRQSGCVVIRALRRGIPSRLYWLVGLADELDAEGQQVRARTVLIDVETGEVVPQ